jgi:hypothetical protein
MSLAPDLVQKLMRLPQRQRAELAHRLLLSLEEPEFDGDRESLWASELERRSLAIDHNPAIGADWRPAAERIRRNLEPELGRGRAPFPEAGAELNTAPRPFEERRDRSD